MMPRINPEVVKAQIASLLALNPDLREDSEALLMSLESETDTIELLTSIVKRIGETEAYMAGTREYIATLRAKIDDMDRWVEGWRRMIFKLMEITGEKSIPLPIGRRLVIQRGQRKVVVVDADSIPHEYLKWEPKLSAIKEALKQGTDVPGTTLSNAEPILTIR